MSFESKNSTKQFLTIQMSSVLLWHSRSRIHGFFSHIWVCFVTPNQNPYLNLGVIEFCYLLLSWPLIGNIDFLCFKKWSDGINVHQELAFHKTVNIAKNKTYLPSILNNDSDLSTKLPYEDICEEFENNRDNENIVCGITKVYKSFWRINAKRENIWLWLLGWQFPSSQVRYLI